jgi:negative regulator of sigma-B (phosphoserine phosphatase)
MPTLDWAFATRTKPGHSDSGDIHLAKSCSAGMLLAVIDGVGHGKEAALAARVARDVVDSYADEPLVSLLHRCHQWLRGTRGVVMSLAWVETESRVMRWAGVGNVQGVLLRRKWGGRSVENSLLLRAGVVGVQLPSLEAAVLPITPGDTLVLATDGVKATFDRSLADKLPPQSAADHILAEYGDAGDDALVLVGRYRGNG